MQPRHAYLEDKGGPMHGFPPFAFVLALCDPLLPVSTGVFHQTFQEGLRVSHTGSLEPRGRLTLVSMGFWAGRRLVVAETRTCMSTPNVLALSGLGLATRLCSALAYPQSST